MDVYADAWPQAISEIADKVADVLFGGSGSNLVADEKSAEPEPAEVIDQIGGPCANRTRDQLVKRIPLKFAEHCDFVGLCPQALFNIFPTYRQLDHCLAEFAPRNIGRSALESPTHSGRFNLRIRDDQRGSFSIPLPNIATPFT